jgi:nucleotide sugar dehydrogenase
VVSGASRPLDELVVVALPGERVQDVADRMASGRTLHYGVALVLDEGGRLLGLFNDGDLLRLVARGEDLDRPIAEVMTTAPIVMPVGLDDETLIARVRAETAARLGARKDLVEHVPLVDDAGVVVDVVNAKLLVARRPGQARLVEVHGLGFVGLTLAVALASRGHRVHGVDVDAGLVARLSEGRPHVHEPRLPELLRRALADGRLTLSTEPADEPRRVAIVAVGTPVDDDGRPDDGALVTVATSIGTRLQRGALVLLRSTVPVGTTRALVVPLLERASGLVAGRDFHVAFTPERTAEGAAMQELLTLPQIVGGLTEACASAAGDFWSTLTDGIVRVDGLEAAELVKLVNNSFRDLSFAFANGVALLADRYNLDARRLINAANEGYPRNPVARPSPGVGGYCLTKDPFLFGAVDPSSGHALLSAQGRRINEEAARYPVRVLDRFAERTGRDPTSLTVCLVGVAFKGWPETSDLRGSASVTVAAELLARGVRVLAFDAVVEDAALVALGLEPVALTDGLARADAVLVMNDHPDNVAADVVSALAGRDALLFDGWGLFDRREVEAHDGLVYATMGYVTPDGRPGA